MNATTEYDCKDKILLTTPELQAKLSCGRGSAIKIGTDAKARVEIGKRVFWNVKNVMEYVNKIAY